MEQSGLWIKLVRALVNFGFIETHFGIGICIADLLHARHFYWETLESITCVAENENKNRS